MDRQHQGLHSQHPFLPRLSWSQPNRLSSLSSLVHCWVQVTPTRHQETTWPRALSIALSNIERRRDESSSWLTGRMRPRPQRVLELRAVILSFNHAPIPMFRYLVRDTFRQISHNILQSPQTTVNYVTQGHRLHLQKLARLRLSALDQTAYALTRESRTT